MQKSLTTVKNESVDIEQLLADAFDLRVTNISESFRLAKKAEKISKENNDCNNLAKAQSRLGFFNMIIGNNDSAREYAKTAKTILEHNKDYEELGLVLYTIGSTYYKTNDYHLGLKYLTDSSLMYQHANDITGQSRALKAIGSIYEFFKEYKYAKETYLKCIELSKKCNDKNGMSNAYINLSGIHLRHKDILQATEVIETAIALKKRSGDIKGLAFAIYGKAKILAYSKKYKKAENLYLESMNLFEESRELIGIMMCYNKLGSLYLAQKKVKQARETLYKVLEKGDKVNHYLIMNKAYYTLYLLEKSEDNDTAAIQYLEQYLNHRDNVVNKDTKNIIESIKSISKMEMFEREARWEREKKEEVERKNAELDTFVYKVSHDLKGPITSLLGLNQLVRLEVKDKSSLKYFKLYHAQISRLYNILMDFINLIKIKEKSIVPVEINFNELVSECIEVHQYYENFKDITFRVDISDLVFYSDKSIINTIVQNLIENAIKYARDDIDSFVDITISKIEEDLCIEVSDNGIGISKEYQSKIFEMFFRANDRIEGSGLGLYILKNAVDKLQGEIKLTSKPKKGAIFQIYIPSSQQDQTFNT